MTTLDQRNGSGQARRPADHRQLHGPCTTWTTPPGITKAETSSSWRTGSAAGGCTGRTTPPRSARVMLRLLLLQTWRSRCGPTPWRTAWREPRCTCWAGREQTVTNGLVDEARGAIGKIGSRCFSVSGSPGTQYHPHREGEAAGFLPAFLPGRLAS